MADEREPYAFFRVMSVGEYVEITIGGRTYDATPDAAREIAGNLMRKATETEARLRQAPRVQGHLRRVK